MKILITGKNGFIAKNIIEYFQNTGNHELLLYSHQDSDDALKNFCQKCDFIYHLSAVQRSNNESDFYNGNVKLTKKIVEYLEMQKNIVPIIFTSSTQVVYDSVFSTTKLQAESILSDYSKKNCVPVYIFRLNHIFGKFGKPNFNNVVSTFLYNAATNKPITVNNLNAPIVLTYIDDLIEDFVSCHNIKFNAYRSNIFYPRKKTEMRLIDLLMIIANIQQGKIVTSNSIIKQLFTTYIYFRETGNED